MSFRVQPCPSAGGLLSFLSRNEHLKHESIKQKVSKRIQSDTIENKQEIRLKK